MTDHDDWAKEDCTCGHRRYLHANGTGPCRHTRLAHAVPDDLPLAEYADGAGPFDEPINWPPSATWPVVHVACCNGFDDERDVSP